MPTLSAPVSHADEAYRRGQAVLAERTERDRKALGQFLTPPAVAALMAECLGDLRDGARLLEPSIGSGVLVAAVLDRAVARDLSVVGYDTDGALAVVAREVLAGGAASVEVTVGDFLATTAPPSGLFGAADGAGRFDAVIANPPYFKLNKVDERLRAAEAVAPTAPNAYAVFMSLALDRLVPGGRAVFLVPRSFCSGAYFGRFRDGLIERAVIERVHLFDARDDAFDQDRVLQENVVVVLRRTDPHADRDRQRPDVEVSVSNRGADLGAVVSRSVPWDLVARRQRHTFFRLPTSELDDRTIRAVEAWPETLASLGLAVATGPVVPFRSRPLLVTEREVEAGRAVPLLWMQNVQPGAVSWPVARGKKPQGLRISEDFEFCEAPGNAVLVRRFSAKEDRRRLTAAPLLAAHVGRQRVAVENHLNVVRPADGSDWPDVSAVGLAALLGSPVVDRYFRIQGGHTQVNAGELRSMPLPEIGAIDEIGRAVQSGTAPDDAVYAVLRDRQRLPDDLPAITETRIRMGKIEEARDVLKALGMPRRQQNEMSALTLLSLAQLSEPDPWSAAEKKSLGIHEIMGEIRDRYDREYAENTRQTLRRKVTHQFEQAGLVVRNPDDPTLATNSPRTHYGLSDAALATVRAFGGETWEEMTASFLERQPSLLDSYRAERDRHRVPLRLSSGEEYHLSPGAHNELQAAIIEQFGPQFAPGAAVLYVGDTSDKSLHLDEAAFESIGVPVPSHDKLPDVVLYDPTNRWLYLVEAVTSHGPMSPKRVAELRLLMLRGANVGVVFVSAFPDVATFKAYAADVAWETEVWIAEHPTHLVHFNGDRFLGPHE